MRIARARPPLRPCLRNCSSTVGGRSIHQQYVGVRIARAAARSA
jgi:hypothetical protein